ncbi:MAG: MotA/TolQ/ExbB proton channel family protein [Planctomycetota bacterium]
MTRLRMLIPTLALVLVCTAITNVQPHLTAAETPTAEVEGEAPPPAPAAETAGEGEATEPAEPEVRQASTLVQRFNQGGITMWILLGLSFIGGSFAVERLARLRRSRIKPANIVRELVPLWRAGDHEGIKRVCERRPSVVSTAVGLMLEHRRLPGAEVSAIVGDEFNRLIREHLQRAYPLAVVATLAPLLGLLGTVSGMIDAFETVAIVGQMGDASILADDISKALVTTAFGLIVSIPALGLYHFFRSRTNNLALEAEEAVNGLLGTWFHTAEPIAAVPDPKAKDTTEAKAGDGAATVKP